MTDIMPLSGTGGSDWLAGLGDWISLTKATITKGGGEKDKCRTSKAHEGTMTCSAFQAAGICVRLSCVGVKAVPLEPHAIQVKAINPAAARWALAVRAD
ncbi:hypothetical protein MHYP_G00147260 [Metynnis hypsauchen]